MLSLPWLPLHPQATILQCHEARPRSAPSTLYCVPRREKQTGPSIVQVLTPAKPLTRSRVGKVCPPSFNGAGRLDRIFTGPFASSGFVSAAVGLVDVGDLGDEWVVGVGVGQHGAYGEENYDGSMSIGRKSGMGGVTFGDCQGWGPLITEDI